MTGEKASIIDRLVQGWPVYALVGSILLGYSEFWIDKKIAAGIAAQTGQVFAVTELKTSLALNTQATQTNTNSINQVYDQVEEVERDTKAILLHLAGE